MFLRAGSHPAWNSRIRRSPGRPSPRKEQKYRLGCPAPTVGQESSVFSAVPAVEQKGLRASVSRPKTEGLWVPASLFLGSHKMHVPETSPELPVPPPVSPEPCAPLSPSYLWYSRSAQRWPQHSAARPQRTAGAAQSTSRRSLLGPRGVPFEPSLWEGGGATLASAKEMLVPLPPPAAITLLLFSWEEELSGPDPKD